MGPTYTSRSEVATTHARPRTISLFGVDVNPLAMEELICLCGECIERRTPILLGVVNVAKLVKARKNPELMESLKEADIVVADGLPVVWLSRLCGCPLPERTAGIDIMYRLLEEGSGKGYAVYFFGAEQSTVECVAAYTKEHYPGVRIAGYHNGFFSSDDEERIADEIRSSQADILFVALPTPRKENFLRRWRQHMGVSVCHGVGGSFDVMAGLTKRAPGWMQKCGMEWFYRLVQEPSRMWKRYLVTNTTFVWLSIVEIVRHRLHLQSKSSEEVVGQ